MNRTIKAIIFLLTLSVFALMWGALPCRADEKALDIVKKMDQILRGDTLFSVSSMEIITPRWKRTLKMKSWSNGTKQFFIHILAPAREKDITFLKDGNLLYQYLPSAEMRIKITPSMMLQSWMGSDFTNDDLVKESSVVNDYTHRILGSETVAGKDCHKIELVPRPQAPVVWGKLLIWVEKSSFLPVRQEFFGEKGDKIKFMEFSGSYRANDRIIPSEWRMVPLNKEGHATVYRIESAVFNGKISPETFTQNNLIKPR